MLAQLQPAKVNGERQQVGVSSSYGLSGGLLRLWPVWWFIVPLVRLVVVYCASGPSGGLLCLWSVWWFIAPLARLVVYCSSGPSGG